MTAEQIVSAIGFFILVSGTLWAIWWRIEGKVEKAKHDASLRAEAAAAVASTTAKELAEHKLHVAETYVSKAGHRETSDQIMSSLDGVKKAIDGTNQRIDRLFDNPPKRTRTSA